MFADNNLDIPAGYVNIKSLAKSPPKSPAGPKSQMLEEDDIVEEDDR